ncbi:MAG TPA: tetratricopeptide repeat protein, partial [Bacteroidia bacterium]|nr:tetratricopeptide repeat protein [Bacteroidia bacterium]
MKLFICLMVLLCFSSFLPAQQRKIDSLKSLLKTDKEDTNKTKHLNALSDKLEIIGGYDSSIAYGIKALLLAQKLDDKVGMTEAYRNIGYAYYDLGDYSEVLKNDSNALVIDKEIENRKGIASDFGSMGRVYSLKGNYGEALACDKRALAIFKEIG